jgi:hypothetical protein
MQTLNEETSLVTMRKFRRLKKFCSAKRFSILLFAIFLSTLLISLHYYEKSRSYVSSKVLLKNQDERNSH